MGSGFHDRKLTPLRAGVWLLFFVSLTATRVSFAEAKNPAKPATKPAAAPANAAPPTAAPAAPLSAQALSRVYEEKIHQVLERFVPTREFEVTATVTPNDKRPTRAPYDPKSSLSGTVQSMPFEELEGYVAKISIEILLSKRLEPSQKKLEELISKTLKLDKKRGDKISFSPLGIEVEDDAWAKQRADLKQELAIAKSEKEKLARELQLAKTETITQKGQQKDNEKPAPPPDTFAKDFWKENRVIIFGGMGALIFAFLIVSIGLLLMGRSVASAGKNMGGAIATIAAAMEGVGSSIASAGAGGGGGGGQTLDAQARRLEAPEAKLLPEGRSSMASLPIESAQTHLLKLQHELLETMNDSTEAIILRHLSHLCGSPVTVAKAVVTMELLGKDTSTELFKRLSLGAQEAVLKFLREGSYDRSKTDLMFEAGEELKTKLLAESFDKARGAASEKVASRLLQLTDDNVVELINEMNPDLLPRLFLYLDAKKIANLLATLKKGDVAKYEIAVSQIAKMPEAEANENLDEDIIAALGQIIDKTKADSQRPFLKLYQEIIERSEDEMKEELLKQLSSDARVDSYLKENIITINTFFVLPDELKNEIIESLSNKDVAALAVGVKEEQKTALLASLAERRQALVNEELDSLAGKGARQSQFAFKRVKEIVVRKLNELKADGSLAKALQANKEGGSNQAA